MLKKLLQPLYAVYALVVFVAGLCITFPFYVLFSIGNNAACRKIIYNIVKIWARSWLLATGMYLQRIGSRPPAGRYVIVINHSSYLDSVVLFPALPGYFRPLGKKRVF